MLDGSADALGQAAEHLRLGDARVPDDGPLIVGVEERGGAVERGVQRRDILLRRRQALVAPRGEIKAEGDKRGDRRPGRDRPPDEIAEGTRRRAKVGKRLRLRRRERRRRRDTAPNAHGAMPSEEHRIKFPRSSSPSAPPHPGRRARTNQSNLTAPPEAEKARDQASGGDGKEALTIGGAPGGRQERPVTAAPGWTAASVSVAVVLGLVGAVVRTPR